MAFRASLKINHTYVIRVYHLIYIYIDNEFLHQILDFRNKNKKCYLDLKCSYEVFHPDFEMKKKSNLLLYNPISNKCTHFEH